jgi:predicted ATPase
MQRFILTGAPGAGKTVLLRQLEVDGFAVVDEAATDVIALDQAKGIDRHWEEPDFIEKIARLQLQRQFGPASGEVQVHDRSLICTHALATYLGVAVPPMLTDAIARSADLFERRVFFVRLLGFITNTEARRISLEDSRRFEAVHEDTYRSFGFDLDYVEPADIAERVAYITARL